MIGFLRGKVLDKQPPWLVLDVGGVGYEIEASMNTFYNLADQSDEVHLFTHMVVREDAQLLYGFASLSERNMFRSLLKVNGVGPKVGLAILSTLSAEEFATCVRQDDLAALVRVPGIGKKTAERLIIEMRDRLPDVVTDAINSASSASAISGTQDAISALLALGYRSADATKAVRGLADTDSKSSESLIRAALKVLAA